MGEKIRSLIGRLRVLMGNRRRAHRYQARFPVVVKLRDSKSKAIHTSTSEQRLPELEGFTRDISSTGLALIIPTIRIGGHYLTDEQEILLISIELPNGVIELQAAPVRYNPLELEKEGEKGYLLGVEIIKMSEDARKSFNDALKL